MFVGIGDSSRLLNAVLSSIQSVWPILRLKAALFRIRWVPVHTGNPAYRESHTGNPAPVPTHGLYNSHLFLSRCRSISLTKDLNWEHNHCNVDEPLVVCLASCALLTS